MLDGRHFTILCDNQAVVQSLTKKISENFSARILRQLQYISQFSTPRILLSKVFRHKVFNIIHSLNHAGIKSSRYLIKQRCYW